MRRPTVADAKARAVVLVTRPNAYPVTGRLLAVPGPHKNRKAGRQARVELPSGAVLSVDPAYLTIASTPEPKDAA